MNAPSIPASLIVHPAKATLLAQIRALEPQIAQLEEERAGCQYCIDEYYRLLRLQLGDLLLETAELQMKLAFQRAGRSGRRSDSEEAQTWQDRFEQTNRVIQEAIAHQPVPLDETAERELRRLYRQAVTLAHPDRHVNDSDRLAKATDFMTQLNDAYKRRDLTAVRQLVQTLTDGRLFAPSVDTNLELDALQQLYQRLVDRQTVLQAQIVQLKAEESYQLMAEPGDLMPHFSNLRQRMQQQIDHLRQLLQAY